MRKDPLWRFISDLLLLMFITFLVSLLVDIAYAGIQKRNVVKVLELKESYDFHLKGNGDLDNLQYYTCHRHRFYYDAGNVKTKVWWWTRTEKDEFVFTYTPTRTEKGFCPLTIAAFNKKGKHSYYYYDFKQKEYNLRATIYCNGKAWSDSGVTVCEAKTGLIQSIEFKEKVYITGSCLDKVLEGKFFSFKVVKDRCTYFAKTPKGRKHRFTLLGYERVE